MTINQALELFEIADISNETEKEIKVKFKKLTKKYHPDNIKTGDNAKFLDVYEAFELLKDTINKLNQYKLVSGATNQHLATLVIPLDKLIHLYDGGKFTMGSGDSTLEVDKKVMSKNNSLIISEVLIEHNGIINSYTNIEKWNISDRYKVYCDINVQNIFDKEKVSIKILDKIREFDMEYQSVTVRFTLQFNIIVDVIISKKLIVESET